MTKSIWNDYEQIKTQHPGLYQIIKALPSDFSIELEYGGDDDWVLNITDPNLDQIEIDSKGTWTQS